ncbi:MAG: N-acetyltransferase [Bacteroidetes bacterium]|nr:N-acetyltransferase [Bacteroidota bacterium]
MEQILRLANNQDLPEINEIYNQAIDTRCSTGDHFHVTMEERQQWFENHPPEKCPVIVYEYNGKIAGWICLSPYRNGRTGFKFTAELSYYVHNNYKQKGIGSILLKSIIEKAKTLNYTTLIAMLFATNIASIKLLEKYQFQKWGCLPQIIDIDDIKYDHLCYGLKIGE